MKARTLFALALTLAVSGAMAAGFNCAKASTQVEREICASPALNKADETMNAIWREEMVDSLLGDKEFIRSTQLEWMKQRNACATRECIAAAYKARYETLFESACSYQMIGRIEPPYCRGLGKDLEAMARAHGAPTAKAPLQPANVAQAPTPTSPPVAPVAAPMVTQAAPALPDVSSVALSPKLKPDGARYAVQAVVANVVDGYIMLRRLSDVEVNMVHWSERQAVSAINWQIAVPAKASGALSSTARIGQRISFTGRYASNTDFTAVNGSRLLIATFDAIEVR